MSLLQIYYRVRQWKKFENRIIVSEVMAKSLVSCFFDSRCSIVSLLYRNTGKYKTVNCKTRLATKLQPCWNYGDTFSLWPIGAQIGLGLHFNNSTAANQSEFFLPARRYASAGTSYGPMSVSLCLSQVGVLSKRSSESSWCLALWLASSCRTRCHKEY